MEKAGWQVTSGILALVAIGGIFGTVANKRALALQLASERTCPQPEPIDQPIPCPTRQQMDYGMLEWPDGVKCRGGVLLIQTEQGFESLTRNGQAMTCTETGYNR